MGYLPIVLFSIYLLVVCSFDATVVDSVLAAAFVVVTAFVVVAYESLLFVLVFPTVVFVMEIAVE